MTLNLVVIRSPDMERLAHFYTSLGIAFTRHSHGNGPEHLSAELGDAVFEIYPETAGDASTLGVRVGFRIAAIESAVAAAKQSGGSVVSQLKNSPWGRRAVLADPEGRRVELVESK